MENICKTPLVLIPPYNLIVFFPTCYKVRLIYYKNQNMQWDKFMDEILIGLWVFINWNWIIFKLIIKNMFRYILYNQRFVISLIKSKYTESSNQLIIYFDVLIFCLLPKLELHFSFRINISIFRRPRKALK